MLAGNAPPKEIEEVKMSVGQGVVKSVGKILELLKEFPDMTRERLAAEVELSVRGAEKNPLGAS